MEARRSVTERTGLVAATVLALVLAAGCGPDDPPPKAAVPSETTVRQSPTSTSSDDEANRQRLNEMARRIAEIKDRTTGNR